MSVRARPSAPGIHSRAINAAELCSGSTGDFGASPRHENHELVSNFLQSRRQGLSPTTHRHYQAYLSRASRVVGLAVTGREINCFLDSLKCSGGGKHAYFRVLRAFYRWLYSPRSGYNLDTRGNPILDVDSPKREKRILPSVTQKQADILVSKAETFRDKCIIRLLFDSGMRLSELTNLQRNDFDWQTKTVTIIGKGNKQRRAPYTDITAKMLQKYLDRNGHCQGNIWGLTTYGVETMLKRLGEETGIQCNPHSFRRGFACNLHRKGLSTLDIMHLGGWSDLSMVLNYTRSITFDDCLSHYHRINGIG